MSKAEQTLGCNPEELASVPGLLLELSTALVPRRIGAAMSLLNMLGGTAHEKVRSLIHDLEQARGGPDDDSYPSALERFRYARDLLIATSRLEQAVFTLVLGRVRKGLSVLGVEAEPKLEEKGGAI